MHRSVKLKVSFATALLAVSLAACTQSFIGRLSGAVTLSESFRYTYLKLRANGDGRYLLPVRGIGGGCTTASLTRSEVETALRTHRVTIRQVRFDSPLATASSPVTVAFDMAADLGACGMGQIVEYDTAQLQSITKDSNNVVTARARPVTVSAKYGEDGIARVLVDGFSLNGQVAGGGRRTGAIQAPLFEVAAGQVQGDTDAVFASANIGTPIAEARVTSLANDPVRVEIEFSFLARPAGQAGVLLLVWDGALMMRTDL